MSSVSSQTRKLRYATQGFAAVHPRYWGAEFEVMISAGNASGLTQAAPFDLIDSDGAALAVVAIKNPLFQHASWPWDDYDSILARVSAAFGDENVKAVCLSIDSPGGDFAGSVELGRALRKMREHHDKPLLGWTDSKALSAAYAIAVACDSICAAPSAFVGSIGVWAPLVDLTAADALQGVRYAIASTGARKLDHNPHVPITKDAFSALQDQVDEMGDMFFAHVAEARGISVDAIRSVQGAEVLASRAKAIALVDDIYDSFAVFLSAQTGLTDSIERGTLNETSQRRLDSSQSGASKAKAMAGKKSYGDSIKEALAAARAAYDEGEGEERENAKKAMRKLEAMFEEGGTEKREDGEKKDEGEAKGESEKKDNAEAKAKAESDKEEAEKKAKAESDKKEADAKAKALADAGALDMAKRIQQLEAERASEKDATRRSVAFASRPDFSKEVRAFLETVSTEQLEKACKDLPRVTGGTPQAAAGALVPTASQGVHADGQGLGTVPADEASFIRSRMGGAKASTGVIKTSRSLELGFMTPAQAAEYAKKNNIEVG